MNDFSFFHSRNASPSVPPSIETDYSLFPQLQKATLALPFTMGTEDLPSTPLQIITPTMPYSTGRHDLSLPSNQDEVSIYQQWIRTLDLPFFQLEAGLYDQGKSYQRFPLAPTDEQRPGSVSSYGTAWSLEHHQDYYQVLPICHAILRDPESLTAVINALLPSTAGMGQIEEQLIISQNNHRSDFTFPKLPMLLIFAIANKIAGLNRVPAVEVIEYLKHQPSTRLLRHVLSTSGPESEAFAENLFRVAIESEDACIIEVLLQKGLDPNDMICTVNGRRYTPIECASRLGNIEITRLLLRANANVNKTLIGEHHGEERGAIECAIGKRYTPEQPNTTLELVRMLLDAGGEFLVHSIQDSIRYHEMELVELLVDSRVKVKPLNLEDLCVILEIVTGQLDNERATKKIMSIYEAVASVTDDLARTLCKDLGGTLNLAAVRGNMDLVRFLLQSGVRLTRQTLSSAIFSTNKDLVRFLLDAGADVHRLDDSDTTALAHAIRGGDIEISELLEYKGAWSWKGENWKHRLAFSAALEAASQVGQIAIVQRVLDHRPPNTTRRDFRCALMAAVRGNQEAVVLALLDAGTDVSNKIRPRLEFNTADMAKFEDTSENAAGESENDHFNTCDDQSRPLHEALRQRNARIVLSILKAHSDVCSSDLLEAVSWGNHSIIEALIAVGIDSDALSYNNRSSITPLAMSVKRNDIKSMQLLLNAGADVNSRGDHSRRTALSVAAANGNFEMVDRLLSIGADPDDTRALLEAVLQGKSIMDKLLTAFSTRYPYGRKGYGCDALIIAIRKGEHAKVRVLLEAGIDANFMVRDVYDYGHVTRSDRLTPLGVAIEEENATSFMILQSLLDANGDPNKIVKIIEKPYKETALLAAIATKDVRKVQLLIDAGANVNRPARNALRRTPLQKAAEEGSYQAIQILLDHGALVNALPAENGGATALQLAAIGGYVGIAEVLLNHGADVNAPAAKAKGRTAVEGAAEHGRIDMLRLLFNAGANFHGSGYERARQRAKDNGHLAVWRYMETLSSAIECLNWDL